MFIVGLVGGIGSGKSRVAGYFGKLGAVVIDADRLGHLALLNPSVKTDLRHRWGDNVFDEGGELNREAIAKLVFEDGKNGKDELSFLESIVHPAIGTLLEKELTKARKNKAKIVVLDAPVMFKTGWDKMCDFVLFVEASFSERLKRVSSRGWAESMLRAREDSQTPLDEKRRRSNRSVNNSQDWAETEKELEKIWDEWSRGFG